VEGLAYTTTPSRESTMMTSEALATSERNRFSASRRASLRSWCSVSRIAASWRTTTMKVSSAAPTVSVVMSGDWERSATMASRA
jgi:hypothetical protein